jgi:hypothetical protein
MGEQSNCVQMGDCVKNGRTKSPQERSCALIVDMDCLVGDPAFGHGTQVVMTPGSFAVFGRARRLPYQLKRTGGVCKRPLPPLAVLIPLI